MGCLLLKTAAKGGCPLELVKTHFRTGDQTRPRTRTPIPVRPLPPAPFGDVP